MGAMTTPADLAVTARAVIDANRYMTLGTTDDDGRPWLSPVYYAASGYREFYWVSPPAAKHSRNLARRPDLSVVIFDSRQPPYAVQAVYMTAVAQELADHGRIDLALKAYPRPDEREEPSMVPGDLLPPAPYRLYLATATRYWVPCPRDDPGQPCSVHGRAADHRIQVDI
jgi:nitroimidazol reductase NimA-like FMN-containing flavoprotein (pyridoxamine 5'-phosphate oxidase superfamily)